MERRQSEWTPERPREQRSARWRELREAYPRIVAGAALAVLALLVLDGWLLFKRWGYQREITRVRGAMTDVEKSQADLLLTTNADRYALQLELVRRRAEGEPRLNLGVVADEGMMYLQQEGARLRAMKIQLGPEHAVGAGPDSVHVVPPRGKRTVLRVADASFAWPVPSWVYAQRGLPVPPAGTVPGALGSAAILLQGGAVIYATPEAGPLADPSYVLPGGVRVETADLQAILQSIVPGMSVYFY